MSYEDEWSESEGVLHVGLRARRRRHCREALVIDESGWTKRAEGLYDRSA